MSASIWDTEIQAAFDRARAAFEQARALPPEEGRAAAARAVGLPSPFPSPADWRDQWIYQIVVDRFNNPTAPPRFPWDHEVGEFQGGTFNGVREQLDYLQELGVGALWLSPVLKNSQWSAGSYHGYGIQDFLAIDPRFASNPEEAKQNPQLVERELRALIDEAHARGIYVIFDIVLNHAGDLFAYDCGPDMLCRSTDGSVASWRDTPYGIFWRDTTGQGRQEWPTPPPNPPADGLVWPQELQRNDFFRRQGNAFTRQQAEQEAGGDFFSLKELVTDFSEDTPQRGRYYPVRDALIHVYQYLIAKYDVDGYRIDTLKFIEPAFARIFGDAIREFALSIGKKNFFTFGEVYDEEEKIARFIGRNAMEPGELVGVDAALDFPLFYDLPGTAKGLVAPAEVIEVFTLRKQVQRGIISSHGDASRYFVTFLDNHDQYQRFYYSDPGDPQRFDDQVIVGVGCLFALQGIPCLYYGTEQGLHGAGGALEAVREAFWGKPGAFDRGHPFYQAIQRLATVRSSQPALRYGRQYFRPISGDGVHFGVSPFPAGVLAFSRILQDQEVVVVANTNTETGWTGEVIVDFALNPEGSSYRVLFSNKSGAQVPLGLVTEKPVNRVEIHEVDGRVTNGPARVLQLTLQPMEIQILGKAGEEG